MDFVNVAGMILLKEMRVFVYAVGCALQAKGIRFFRIAQHTKHGHKAGPNCYTAGAEGCHRWVNNIGGSVANRCNGCRASTQRFLNVVFNLPGLGNLRRGRKGNKVNLCSEQHEEVCFEESKVSGL